MFCSHDVCVAWAHLRLTNLKLAVHVGIKSAVPSPQTEQNVDLWTLSDWLEFGYCCFHFILGEFDDSFFIGIRGVSVGPAGILPKQACLLVHFLGSCSVL